MLKAWHSHGNTLRRGRDFYPELAEVGKTKDGENGCVSTVLCDAIVCSGWRISHGNARKREEGNGHNDAHYCDSPLGTRVRRGRLLLEGPATVGISSART